MKILVIILVFGLVNEGFSQNVTNRQILEKLEKMETKLEKMDAKINSLDVRITRVEEGQKSLQKQVDILSSGLKDVRAEIKDVVSDIKGFMLWGFGVLFLGMFSLVGFVLWDRRSALAPAVREIKALEEREGRLESVLREFAKIEPKFAEVFRYAGFL